MKYEQTWCITTGFEDAVGPFATRAEAEQFLVDYRSAFTEGRIIALFRPLPERPDYTDAGNAADAAHMWAVNGGRYE